MNENQISRVIVEAAIGVHRTLGSPGLLESVYEEALAWELIQRGLSVEKQKEVPIIYKNKTFGASLRLDLLVNNSSLLNANQLRNIILFLNLKH
jgi:GxxExxY protein